MADVRGEPTMEDILASIRRIIAEDPLPQSRPSMAAPRASEPAAAPFADEADADADHQPDAMQSGTVSSDPLAMNAQDDALLRSDDEGDYLSETENASASIAAHRAEEPATYAGRPAGNAYPAENDAPSTIDDEDEVLELTEYADKPDEEAILSDAVAHAASERLQLLNQMLVRPESGSMTLEGLVRDMLRPMLKEWLDANLPEIVEQVVSREIARLTGKGR